MTSPTAFYSYRLTVADKKKKIMSVEKRLFTIWKRLPVDRLKFWQTKKSYIVTKNKNQGFIWSHIA